jgi:hypothetical protein
VSTHACAHPRRLPNALHPLPPPSLPLPQQQPSRCNTECATIARACAQAADALDLSDLSEALFNGISRSKLTSQACYESSSLCRDKPPPVPKVRALGCGVEQVVCAACRVCGARVCVWRVCVWRVCVWRVCVCVCVCVARVACVTSVTCSCCETA